MAKTAILSVKIVSDATKAADGFNQATTTAEKFESGLRKANVAALAVGGGLVAIGKTAFDSASRLQQAGGAVDSVFGSNADAVNKFASQASQSLGLSQSEYSEFASVIGAQFKNLGVNQDELAGKTNDLIGIGADLAATFGGTTGEAVEALGAAFRGEFDPIERYGLAIRKSDVNARLAAQGQSHLTGEALKAAEQQAIMAMLFEQSADAQGQFSREADTAAGQQQRFAAELENTKAALGQALLPIVAAASEQLQGMAQWVQQNADWLVVVAGVIAGVAGAIIAMNAAITAYRTIMTIATAVQAAFNAVMMVNPFVLIAVAVIALIAAVVVLYKNCETFRNIVDAAGRVAVAVFKAIWDAVKVAWDWIVKLASAIRDHLVWAFETARSVGTSVWDAIKRGVDIVRTAINNVVTAVRNVINWIGRIRFPSPPRWMSSILGGSGSAEFMFGPEQPMSFAPAAYEMFAAKPPELEAASARTPLSALVSAGSGKTVVNNTNVNIKVEGALDPVAVGDQIKSVLSRHDVHVGAVSTVNW